MEYVTVLFWALIGSVVSLIGGVLLIGSAKKRAMLVRFAMPFGAGSMLATAFLGLIPEAAHDMDIHQLAMWVLSGFLLFFMLERGLSWFHHHHHDDVHGSKNKAHISLVIAGDTLHNAIDGVVIGAAFIVNPAAGISAALAVAAHEIPQEIGDFGILLGKGMRARKVLLVNVMSALATVVTAMLAYAFGREGIFDVSIFLAIAAGFFIYIAAADIIPDIHERPHKEATSQAISLLIGVAMIGMLLTVFAHEHGDHESSRETSSAYASD